MDVVYAISGYPTAENLIADMVASIGAKTP